MDSPRSSACSFNIQRFGAVEVTLGLFKWRNQELSNLNGSTDAMMKMKIEMKVMIKTTRTTKSKMMNKMVWEVSALFRL